MTITPRSAGIAVAVLTIAMVAPAGAQVPGAPKPPSLGLTVGLKVTSLGFGPEIGFKFLPRVGIRAGGQWASLNGEMTISNTLYAGNVKWRSFDALFDLHLLGPIHAAAGVVRNGNRLEVSADPTISTTIGGTTYTASQIGTITGKIDFAKVAPYAGLDFVMGGKVGILLELGAMFQGTPKVSYTATTTLTGAAKAQFDTEVTNELAQIQQDLNGRSYLKIWPVVGLGLQIKI
ncbi:MAG: hypothetical protein HY700_12205 [Gemmatimonadetes bacterium]|nr:hypothetical protein [Gemmatimonadota bacterium]